VTRSPRDHPLLTDSVIGLVCLALVTLEIWFGSVPQSARFANLAVAPFFTLPLALRRRYPVAVALVALAAVKVEILAGGATANTIAPILPISIAVYSLAVHAGRRSLIGGGAAAALLVLLATGHIEDALFAGVLLAIPFALGLIVRSRQQRVDRLQADAGIAVAEERQRIARELHDVIAHSVGVMTVQASAGRRVMGRNPELAAEALEAIEATGRQALSEMARMVSILRDDTDQVLEPQPGLGRLESLLNEVRAAGLEVSLEMEPAAKGLPPGLDLAAYRIVQEALTNAMRHSSAREARVSVRRCGDDLEIEIEDPGPAKHGTTNSGHGLVGMQERAHLYGGRIDAHRTPSGGYAVQAWLPVES
jgi:signal transduction histidine kinase